MNPSDLPPFVPPGYESAGNRLAQYQIRRSISAALLLADLAVLVLTVMDVHGVARFILGLILGLVTPGWSIIGLLKLHDAALEIALAVAVSLALLLVVAQVMMTVHAWHPIVLQEVVCLICIPPLGIQVGRVRRSRGAGK